MDHHESPRIGKDRCAQCQDPNVAHVYEFLEGHMVAREFVGESKTRYTYVVVKRRAVGICRRCARRERLQALLYLGISVLMPAGSILAAAATGSRLWTALCLLVVPLSFGFLLAGLSMLTSPAGQELARTELEKFIEDDRQLFTPKEAERHRRREKRRASRRL